jgi:chromosome segregation ATPase
LEQKNLKFEAQINSLEQELETRGESYRLLQQDYDNVTKEFDRSTGENRVNRIAIEQTQLEMELTIKNQRSKIESLENSLDESRDLHQKTQLRLKDAVKNLSNDATVRIELNTKLGSLENDMDALKRDKQSTENVLSSTSKELEKVKAELLEANNSLRLCKEQLKDRDADCLMRTKRAEVSTKQAMEELSTTKDELSLSFQRQESLAKQVKDLEAKLNAKPDIETIEKHEYDKLQERCHALKAELDGVTQLLLAKDSLISKLRGDVVDAEAFVRSKRQNFARRDSIAARQAASLSAQLQAANARIDAMNETLSAKDIELNGLKKRLDSSDASLEQGRDEKSKYLKSYEEVLSQKKIIDEQLKQTREELEAKLYIIQQLNQRLATLESEITTSENDQRVSNVLKCTLRMFDVSG